MTATMTSDKFCITVLKFYWEIGGRDPEIVQSRGFLNWFLLFILMPAHCSSKALSLTFCKG